MKSIAHSLGIDIYDMFHRGKRKAVKEKRNSQEFVDEILIEGGKMLLVGSSTKKVLA